jgi:ABC-type glycerol-3-phosphate transport system substrate-binding protein
MLACLLLFGIPAKRRSWRTMVSALAMLAILAGGMAACGGAGSTPAGGGNPGTTPGAYTVTVTGSSGVTTETGTVTVNVQ